MHPPEQAVHPPKRFSIKTLVLFHVRIAILTKWQSYFFAQNSLEIKGLSAFQQQIRKTYLSIKQEGFLHCYHSC
jgi:hypothetical protein